MGCAKQPADLENTQLKMSHLISCNAGPDSTHSNIMDAQLCTFSLSVPGQRALTVTVSVSQTN